MSETTRDWDAFITKGDSQNLHMDLAVDGITCAACIYEIERDLEKVDGIERARLNYTSHRLGVEWKQNTTSPDHIVSRLERLGYKVYPFDPAQVKERGDKVGKDILRSLAVSGFASMNIMLLSISVWSGNHSDIDEATRSFFHWLSALIALPTVAYSGRIFFKSAYRAIRQRNLNMDVPISIGVLLATALSLVQTIFHAKHAYFDSAVMLLFFLLAGRYFDHMMRRKTRSFAENLAVLKAESATKIQPDGSLLDVPLSKLQEGDLVIVRPGERISVDGLIVEGVSSVDQSLVTGETKLHEVSVGSPVYAGTMNAQGQLTLEVIKAAQNTLLDQVNKLLETAMEARGKYVQIADKASQLYAPLVHTAALLTLIGWLIFGAGWQHAIIIAISVLIITCPCALGLAIPAVQVVASGLFFDRKILLNSGDAIERLAKVDTIVFDKTGTLTTPDPQLLQEHGLSQQQLIEAARLGLSSSHPLSKAIVRAAYKLNINNTELTPLKQASETAGQGVAANVGEGEIRLGSPKFCGVKSKDLAKIESKYPEASIIAYKQANGTIHLLPVAQSLRSDAQTQVSRLLKRGYDVQLLSGDRASAVEKAAKELAIESYYAQLQPQEKIAYIEKLRGKGKNVLMVGDGLNDAPALAAANVSISPVSAVHLSQAAADAIFLGEPIAPVFDALNISRRAHTIMQQNLWLSGVYNLLSVPVAVAGYVTPLLAALAMSGSSVVVTLNALRLRLSFLSASEPDTTYKLGK
ncbi:heavy metal translocating P-type ATPase [Polycladidibacter stylochi]|uniref:heavy metal translocating P-type ATPase n=1 Tax=Polycladidibacter stylochi TaxID=1807766 RepID=UPI00082B453B|nr:heavy metal translocating P-type ATPase [Pseudovibrio stylochi]